MRWRTRPAAILAVLPLLAATALRRKPRVQVVPDEAAPQGGRHRRRQAVHLVHLADDAEEAGAVSAAQRQGHARDARLPARPAPGERVDHPHHVGLWFNHGDVNGFDFWNNSDAIPAAQAAKMGTIVHQKIVEAKSGSGQGDADGRERLEEAGRLDAPAGAHASSCSAPTATSRTIDRITTLTALGEQVVFNDNKEGVIGMRVARGLEQPSTQAGDLHSTPTGKPTPAKVARQHRRAPASTPAARA